MDSKRKKLFSFYNMDWLDGFISGIVISVIVVGITGILTWTQIL